MEREVITDEDVRMARESQADRMESYRFKLWIMGKEHEHDGHKRIH